MERAVRYIPAALIVLALVSPARADLDDGVAAFNRGDYATALREFQHLAEQCSALAQHNLGFMYELGRGVPQDYNAAAKWYREAAEQGDAQSQDQLGRMYSMGRGEVVPNGSRAGAMRQLGRISASRTAKVKASRRTTWRLTSGSVLQRCRATTQPLKAATQLPEKCGSGTCGRPSGSPAGAWRSTARRSEYSASRSHQG